MDKNTGKTKTAMLGQAILAWLFSSAALMLIGTVLVGRFKLREAQLGWISAAVLFCSSALTCFVYVWRSNRPRPMSSALAAGLILSVLLLMTGFLADADAIGAGGVGRVIAGCFGGALFGAWAGGKRKSKPGRTRFKARKTG